MTGKKLDHSLRTRVKSAALFAPPVLFVLWWGGYPFTLMMALGAMTAAFEWSRMVMTGKRPPRQLTRLAAGICGLSVLSAGLNTDNMGHVKSPIMAFCFLLALCFLLFAYNFSRRGPALRELMLGVVYVGFSMQVMIWLRNSHPDPDGLDAMLTLLLIIWASDSSAYFAGKAIGGPKLAPKISPKKTWAGFLGSSVGAGAVASALACPLFTGKFHTVGGLGTGAYFALGFLLGAVGQMGDLFKSIFKRRYGLKDMGTLIPGHGGLLDRIDALLAAALAFGMIAMAVGGK
jgi:phosphatidate cytidylyltransferase